MLGVRRSLDYLTRALAAYFKNHYHSFRTFPKTLLQLRPVGVATAIVGAHQRHVDKFDYVLGSGEKKSTRDLMTHYEYISAGSLNLSRQGRLMMGGGENLQPSDGNWEVDLTRVIDQRLNDLNDCVADMVVTFVAAVTEAEATGCVD